MNRYIDICIYRIIDLEHMDRLNEVSTFIHKLNFRVTNEEKGGSVKQA